MRGAVCCPARALRKAWLRTNKSKAGQGFLLRCSGAPGPQARPKGSVGSASVGRWEGRCWEHCATRAQYSVGGFAGKGTGDGSPVGALWEPAATTSFAGCTGGEHNTGELN